MRFTALTGLFGLLAVQQAAASSDERSDHQKSGTSRVQPFAVINPGDPKPVPNEDDSTICAVPTPPETVATDPLDDYDPLDQARPSSFLVPSPGSTFIIRCVTSGRVITLLDGQIVLTQPGGHHGSIYWTCVENEGWLGFRNTVSGMFLGHDDKGNLNCSAKRHLSWEYFNISMRTEGGAVLLMTHFDKLWHVGIKMEADVEKLAKIAEGGSGGIVWEFIKV